MLFAQRERIFTHRWNIKRSFGLWEEQVQVDHKYGDFRRNYWIAIHALGLCDLVIWSSRLDYCVITSLFVCMFHCCPRIRHSYACLSWLHKTSPKFGMSHCSEGKQILNWHFPPSTHFSYNMNTQWARDDEQIQIVPTIATFLFIMKVKILWVHKWSISPHTHNWVLHLEQWNDFECKVQFLFNTCALMSILRCTPNHTPPKYRYP